jgi:hypothetical protein
MMIDNEIDSLISHVRSSRISKYIYGRSHYPIKRYETIDLIPWVLRFNIIYKMSLPFKYHYNLLNIITFMDTHITPSCFSPYIGLGRNSPHNDWYFIIFIINPFFPRRYRLQLLYISTENKDLLGRNKYGKYDHSK